jgi:antitoxin MazE
MEVEVQKWGDGLAIRIPDMFAIESKTESGSKVQLSVEQGRTVIAPLTEPKLILEGLLAKVTKQNLHHETDFRGPVGTEVW